MSQIVVDLSKKVKIVADMMKLGDVKAQVALYVDGSGSMESGRTLLYSDGTVQNTLNRIAAVALQFDDNGELDTATFSNSISEAPVVKLNNVDGYVQRELIGKNRVAFGGTNYAPIITHAIEQYFDSSTVEAVKASASSVVDALKNVFGFGKKEAAPAAAPVASNGKSKSGLPVYVIIITDGDNFDESATTALLEQMQDKNIYWQFVGIGTATTFKYCNKVADDLPNVGFFQIPDLNAMKDMELYKKLMNAEFSEWMKKF